MRVDIGDFWAEVRAVWRYSDQMAVRSAATRPDGTTDAEAANSMIILRSVEAWSAGEVTQDVLDELPAEVANRLYDEIMAAITGGDGDPKGGTKSSSTRRRKRAAS